MKRKALLTFLLVALCLVACSQFVTNAYRGLMVSKEAYDAALSAMGDLYKEGVIGEQEKEKAIELGRIYKQAHNDAVAALEAYEASGAETDKDKYLFAVGAASAALADLIAYCRPYLE